MKLGPQAFLSAALFLGPALGITLRGRQQQDAQNPLLTRLDEVLPPFDALRPKHCGPAIDAFLLEAKEQLRQLEAAAARPEFRPGAETLLRPYSQIGDRLWSTNILCGEPMRKLEDSAELRQVIEKSRPSISKFRMELAQSVPVYHAFKVLSEDAREMARLSVSEQRLVSITLQDFQTGGVGLKGDSQAEFNNITHRLGVLGSLYSRNVMDSQKSWNRWATKEELAGLPQTHLDLARESATKFKEVQLQGAASGSAAHGTASSPHGKDYLITLASAQPDAVLAYAEDADLRREIYLAIVSTASELLPPDNGPVAREILALRHRKAEMLGFKSFAEMALMQNMARPKTAEKLLEELSSFALPRGKQDLKELEEFAQASGNKGKLNQWDLKYWSSRHLEAKYHFNSEEFRAYFPLDRCLEGLFGLAQKMFAVDIKRIDGPKWNKDVELFSVLRNGSEVGFFYTDLWARPGKKHGAWHHSIVGYDQQHGRKPVSVIAASFRPPAAGQQPLLATSILDILFHEFGHTMQALLTTQPVKLLAGVKGVPRDAVELPSQFMEMWLREVDWVVKGMARHHETGEQLSDEKIDAMQAVRKYHSAWDIMYTAHLAFLDLDLHTKPLGEGESLQEREAGVAKARNSVLLEKPEQSRCLCSFEHIFSGGYAARYYSYQWAEVLAADAFSRFEEEGATAQTPEGLSNLAKIGGEFAATFLAEGGGREAETIYENFRGRPPSPRALLHYFVDR